MELNKKQSYNNRFTVNIKRISWSFVVIITVGITAFYFAKKEINDNRQRLMIVKKEINEKSVKYPSRNELIREMKEKAKHQENQTHN